MAYYGIIIILLLVINIGVHLSFEARRPDMLKICNDAFDRGYALAKEAYYTEPVVVAKQANEAAVAALRKENEQFHVTSELLMAYGVNTLGQLPKAVRDQYKIEDDMLSIDIDTLVAREVNTDADI